MPSLKKLLAGGIFALFLVVPFGVSADTLTPTRLAALQAQIAQLLQMVASLQAQLNAMQGSVADTSTATTASATIDQSSLTTTSFTPTITGTASGTRYVGLTLGGQYGDKVYGSGNNKIRVVNGHWSVTIPSNTITTTGQYSVRVYDNNSNLLATGTLFIGSSTSQPSISVDRISDHVVTVSYANLPKGAYINLLWRNESGQNEQVGQVATKKTSGTVKVTLPDNAPNGTYTPQAFLYDGSNWSFDGPTFVFGSADASLNCTMTASPWTVSAGQSVTLSWKSLGASYGLWKQDGSANLLGLPADRVTPIAQGSATFVASGKGYVSPTLTVYRDNGLSGSCGTTITITGDSQTASATIDQNSLVTTSLKPTITGTASGVNQIVLVIFDQSTSQHVWGKMVPVTNGRWSVASPVSISLPSATDSYKVTVSTVDSGQGNTLLATGMLVVLSPTSLGTYTGYLGGSQFIRTANMSQSDALANCKLNANSNPDEAISCTWNGTVIFTHGGSASSGSGSSGTNKPGRPTASYHEAQ